MTARVVDEQGSAVLGATVKFFFTSARGTDVIAPVAGTTNSDGEFSGEGYSEGSYGALVVKEGYYLSGLNGPSNMYKVDRVLNRWQPWNATYTSILRPIGKPVALYARKFRKLEIPVVGQPCGFDLMVSDWVAPWGKGKVSDLIMTVEQRTYEGWRDFDVAVSIAFANAGDGILETKLPEVGRDSEFKWERFAPEANYTPAFKTRFSSKTNGSYASTTSENQSYFFRVRIVEENGRIESALYGKISGGIRIEARETKTCSIAFTYYLNPTPLDRNLEWNPKQNLLRGLRDAETPREP